MERTHRQPMFLEGMMDSIIIVVVVIIIIIIINFISKIMLLMK